MPHLFAPSVSPAALPEAVREALAALPDDYWVFLAPASEQPITCVIAREANGSPEGTPALFCTVVLEPTTLLRGTAEGIWSGQSAEGQWLPIGDLPSGAINYYQLTCDVAAALGDRLRARCDETAGQAGSLAGRSSMPRPVLLLLGPAHAQHRLPLMPPDDAGEWYFSIETWRARLASIEPASSLDRASLQAMAHALGVVALNPAVAGEAGILHLPTQQPEVQVRTAGPLADLVAWLANLDRRVAELEPGATPVPVPDIPARRALTPTERDALVEAVRELRQRGASRALPAVLERMSVHLGYRLKDTGYNGFQTARAFFDQAERAAIIRYGPLSGPNPTILLAEDA